MLDPLDHLGLEAAAAEGTLGAWLAEWAPRMDTLRASAGPDRARWTVLRAVRLELPLIVERPSELFGGVERRLRGLSAARGWLPWLRDDTPDVVEVHLASWRRSRADRGLAPAVRSLRDPSWGVASALQEEYRPGPRGAGGRLALTDDTVSVGADPHRITWDRASGVRRAEPLLPAAEALVVVRDGPHVADRTVARCADPRTGALVVDTVLPFDGSVTQALRTPDGWVLLAGWEGDGAGLVVRLDPPFRDPTWTLSVDGVVHDLAGGRVAVAARGLTLATTPTGRVAWKAELRCTQVALDPHGETLATVTDGVVRVWPTRTAPPPPALPGTRTAGVLAFSPDGNRLLTGSVLCDGAEGRVVARLDLDTPGAYLEGGPPRGGHALGDRRFVQFGALPGVRAWDTERGRVTWQRRSRVLRHVAVSPDTSTAVLLAWGAKAADLVQVDDGAGIAQIAFPGVSQAWFSPTGRALLASESGALRWVDGRTGAVQGAADGFGRITDAVFSADGALVVLAGEDRVLRAWALGDDGLRLVDTRRVGPEAWRATTNARRALEGWAGFVGALHPFRGRRAGAWFEIVDRRDGRCVAAIPTPDDLVSDGTGQRWAGPDVHVTLR